MNQQELLPKKMIFFAVFISMIYLVGILSLTLKLSSQFDSINNTHLPLLEMNSINVRLGDSLSSKAKALVHDYNISELEEYRIDKDSLKFNFRNYINTLKTSNIKFDGDLDFDRDALFKIENKVLELAKNKKKLEALTLLSSSEYSDEQFKFLSSIQTIAEKLSAQRDFFLKEQSRVIQAGIVFSIITFILIGMVWFKIYVAYKKNSRERAYAIEELTFEKVKSSHNAKMASLGEMAAGLAHEINNPLTIIQGFSERLLKIIERDDFDEYKIHRYAEKINSTSVRINTMVQGLKVFSKNTKEADLTLSLVDEIVEDTLSFCREKFKSSGIDLSIVCDSDEPVYVMARPVEISQVLLNLLNNAYDELESSDELINSWIKIETKQDENNVYISVEDSGLGISDEVKEKIFDPFFTTKDGTHGTGLGLSISSSIVKKHRGELYLDNAITTEFVIKLPRPRVDTVEKVA